MLSISAVQWLIIVMAALGGWTATRWLCVLGVRVRARILAPLADPPAVEECEVCGEPAGHRIVSEGDGDGSLGITKGGTLMAADFCAEHCPGGCRAGCQVQA